MTVIKENDGSNYEERADYIDYEDMYKWNVDIPHYKTIQKKLIEKGSKLIIGPRGTGKTHQMRVAYNVCLKDSKKPFPIYVSFNRYFYLEPLLSKNPAARTIFHTWTLCIIVLGCLDTIDNITNEKNDLSFKSFKREQLERFVVQSEKSIQEDWHNDIINNVTISDVIAYLTASMVKHSRKRAILLLDDAAYTLTKEYMVEFFDIFRCLKTANISPKASVYPGTTEYGPRFHVKQDGEPINVWFEPESADYSDFIDLLCERRFLDTELDDDIKQILRYASFGNPRSFITLLRDYEKDRFKSKQANLNSIFDARCNFLKDEYHSIKQKLVQYCTIIDIGWEFFEKVLDNVTLSNISIAGSSEKITIVGIKEYKGNAIDRMIRFLVEAGLLYELTPVKHGEKREYKRYIFHLVFLFHKRAFSKSSRGFNIAEILRFLERKNTKHPLRMTIKGILGSNAKDRLLLNLPQCTKCGSSRLSENQKFCHNCGHELASRSSFKECMKLTIDKLPLTHWQKERIKSETSLRTVQDFVAIQDIGAELQKPYGIGKKRAEKIDNAVKIIIEEFLA